MIKQKTFFCSVVAVEVNHGAFKVPEDLSFSGEYAALRCDSAADNCAMQFAKATAEAQGLLSVQSWSVWIDVCVQNEHSEVLGVYRCSAYGTITQGRRPVKL